MTTQDAVPLPHETSSLTVNKGILAYGLVHKSENKDGFFPPVHWQLITNRYTFDSENTEKRVYAKHRVYTNTSGSDFFETDRPDYNAIDVAYVYEPGNHAILQGSLHDFMKTAPYEREFKIRADTITYIGDFTYESLSTGKNFNYTVKRVLLEIKCTPEEFKKRFRAQYPNHSDKPIHDACIKEGRFRRYPANDSVHMHFQYTPAG